MFEEANIYAPLFCDERLLQHDERVHAHVTGSWTPPSSTPRATLTDLSLTLQRVQFLPSFTHIADA